MNVTTGFALQLSQKLEELSAHIKHDTDNIRLTEAGQLSSLEEDVDVLLAVFRTNGGLLPSRIRNIPPNVNGWKETKAAMLPTKKT